MCCLVTRLNQPTERRTPLPLTALDLEDLARLRGPGPEREALATSLPPGEVSKALPVHAVFVVGLQAVTRAAEERSYAEAALERQATVEADRVAARRRRLSGGDED